MKSNAASLPIAVVGAGAAGLYAAELLLRRGLPVLLFEASGRPGGRVRSLAGFGGRPLEMGAEQFHGRYSRWFRMLARRGAPFRRLDGQPFWRVGGSWMPAEAARRLPDFAQARRLLRAAEREPGPELPVEAWLLAQGLHPRWLDLANALLGNEYGSSNRRLSRRGIAEQLLHWHSGEANYVLEGWSMETALQRLCPRAWQAARLRTPIVELDYASDPLRLRDAGGRTHLARQALITVPLALLKKNVPHFFPALPAEKQAAIGQIGMDAGFKMQLRFRRAFWPPGLGSLLGGGAAPEYWAPADAGPLLTAFAVGEAAEALCAAGPDAPALALRDLDACFGGQASACFEAAIMQDWLAEPWIGGGYSFPTPGGGLAARQALAAPLAGRVFFAGEATSPGHQATVHGAIESALRAVREMPG